MTGNKFLKEKKWLNLKGAHTPEHAVFILTCDTFFNSCIEFLIL